MPDISHLIPYLPTNSGSSSAVDLKGGQDTSRVSNNGPLDTSGSGVGTGPGPGSGSGSSTSTGGNPKPKQPYFFEGLNTTRLSREDATTHGLLRIAKEIYDFSSQRLVSKYVMCSAFLTRALIEQSLIYYAKKHCVQGSSKMIWDHICHAGKNSQLSKIIDQYNSMKLNYISDKRIHSYFEKLFGNYNETINPLNWVVHRPDEYIISPEELITLPSGLLTVINYLLA